MIFKESDLKNLLVQPIEEVEKLSKRLYKTVGYLYNFAHTDRTLGAILALPDYEYSLRDAARLDFFVSGY